MAEPSPSEGGGKDKRSLPASNSSSQRATLMARQKAAEAKLKRKVAELAHQVAKAEEEAARAELEAESAAIEAEKTASCSTTASMKRTAQWVNDTRSAARSPSRLMEGQQVRSVPLLPECKPPRSPCVVKVPQSNLLCEDVQRTMRETAVHLPFGEGAPSPAKARHEPQDVPIGEVCRLANAITLLAQNCDRPKSVIIDLISFSGNISDWSLFKKSFDDTKAAFSDRENMARLRKALCGAARETVKSLLLTTDDPELVIRTLELNFARPEQIVLYEIAAVRALPKMTRNYDIFTFSARDKWLDFADHHFDLETPMLELLATFLEQEASKRARFSPSPLLCSSTPDFDKSKTQPPAFHRVHAHTTTNKLTCLFCSSDHTIKSCPKFISLSIDERLSWVRQSKVCPKCIRKAVNSTSVSQNVNINDNIFNRGVTDQAGCEPIVSAESNVISFSINEKALSCRKILLKIVPVILSGPGGEVLTHALLDDGSTTTLIDAELADALGLVGPEEDIFMGGVSGSRKVTTKRVNFGIRGKNSSEVFNICEARTVQKLLLASQSVRQEDVLSFSYLSDIANELTYERATPKVLIGICDWHLLVSKDSRFGSSLCQPAAIRTVLGWVLYGYRPKFSKNIPCVNHCSVSDKDEELNSLIRDYYKLESIGIKQHETYTSLEQRAVTIVEETTRRLPNGRFEVGLPWREDDPRVPDSYYLALSRLLSLSKRFKRDSAYLDCYTKNIDSYTEKGYAEECVDSHNPTDDSSRRWYLPHFGVTNVNKPGKLRIVHDAAAQTHGVSLNSLLLPGPDLLQSLLGVLVRFREGQVALTGDIREMFPQIKIRSEDRNFQRYLWRPNGVGRVMEFRMSSLIFGASCSPFIANFIKNRNAKDFEFEFPDAAKDIVQNHYMDDYLGSYDLEQAAQVAADIVHVHSQCGFEMRSWISNKPEALKLLPPILVKDDIKEVDLNLEGVGFRVLGLYWIPHDDNYIQI
ncbi:uncharacterized protein LOC113227096 [Hyposmocoma kahamanoa]|uniref:uncharacterized protein LOC113227096 n=1 Tax=Hyposmocoma kahamanoa TaxID=1477025 RepID=UPI000E6D89F1|nr:uncharacterized protein LOC113227096 [Hyposmocoma kahamanoa]